MRRPLVIAAVIAVGLTAGLVLTGRSAAGPDRIAVPAGWKDHVLYTTVDRHDVKQYRELYASTPEAVQAMREGKPLPHGTVLTLIQYKAQVDAQGAPLKDASGRFVKSDLIAYTVMEKRQGWGAEYPDDLRNGDWEYAAIGPRKLTAATGKPVTWVNHDDSPHQITITTGAESRGPVLTKGQGYTRAFAAAGTYDYICGLHPSMKGQVEVR